MPEFIAGYSSLEKIGAGLYGAVYKSFQDSLKRWVVVKIFYPKFTKTNEQVEDILLEAKRVAKFSHPNLISIYDVGTYKGLCYIIMELVDGRNIAQLIERGGALEIKRVLGISFQIANVLEYLNSCNASHQNIKLSNIFITSQQAVKLAPPGFYNLFRLQDEKRKSIEDFFLNDPRNYVNYDIYCLGKCMRVMINGLKESDDVDSTISTQNVNLPEDAKEYLAMLIEKLLETNLELTLNSNRDVMRTLYQLLVRAGLSLPDIGVYESLGEDITDLSTDPLTPISSLNVEMESTSEKKSSPKKRRRLFHRRFRG